MSVVADLAAYLFGRRRRKHDQEFSEAADSRVRVAQDVMEQTVARLHAELMDAEQRHDIAINELREEYEDLARALQECDRHRVRLMVQIADLEAGGKQKKGPGSEDPGPL